MRVNVSDLLARPGSSRHDEGTLGVAIELPEATVEGDATVGVTITSMHDGVMVRGEAGVTADLICNRCLTTWESPHAVHFEQVFRVHPDDVEEELGVEPGGWIDLEQLVHDELSLGLPQTPVCKPDCRGLCPTCGTDLNVEPCDGHGDVGDSPFAALKELFEP